MARVYAVGVGPGSPRYVTGAAADAIRGCDVVVGYRYTLNTIRGLISGMDVREVTMQNQEEAYQGLAGSSKRILVPFTGDVSFSESEVVDRLVEIFGDVEIVPGISSVQVAAARAAVPLDKSRVITMHVTSSIEGKKRELVEALAGGQSVILVPRPWPNRPDKQFMPSEAALHLRGAGLDTGGMGVKVFENLTMPDEAVFEGTVNDLVGREFSSMCVMVFARTRPDSYMNYRWQWERPSSR